MAFEQFGKIEDIDINTNLIGPATAAQRLNTLWGTGFGSRGYGQTPLLPTVNKGDPVLASDWANIRSRAIQITSHQNTQITWDFYQAGARILYNNGEAKTAIDKLDANRMSSLTQANYQTFQISNDYPWTSKIVYTMTATFANGDAARYFFNCGGQFAVRVWQPGLNTSIPIQLMMAKLANDVGIIYWSAIAGGSTKTKIMSVDYAATTKIGGVGTPTTLAGSQDYFATSTYTDTPVSIFRQVVSGGVAGYAGSFIDVAVATSGDKGSNGANGNIIKMVLTVDLAPQSALMPAGGIAYFYYATPQLGQASELFTESWGTPSISLMVAAT
jgi:hypothetical protein